MQTRSKISLIFTASGLIDSMAKDDIKNKNIQKLVIGSSDTIGAVLSIMAVIHHFKEGNEKNCAKKLVEKVTKPSNKHKDN